MTTGTGVPYLAVKQSTLRWRMSTQRPETSEDLAVAPDQPSKKRRVAFRVVATLVALFILAQQIFALMELVVMWFPAEALAEMFEEEVSFIVLHRAHFMAVGIIAWAVVPSMLVQLRKPERRVAPMVLVIAIALGATIVYGLSGTLSEWLIEEIAVVVPISLVVFLHPSRDRLFSKPGFDRPLAGMAALATAPWLVYIVENAWTQFTNAAGDPHAEMEHWATAALMGIVIVVAAFLGSSDHPGWRLTGWIAAGGSVIFGVHSLVFPGVASALPGFWAVLAILWGIGFGAMMIRRGGGGEAAVVDV